MSIRSRSLFGGSIEITDPPAWNITTPPFYNVTAVPGVGHVPQPCPTCGRPAETPGGEVNRQGLDSLERQARLARFQAQQLRAMADPYKREYVGRHRREDDDGSER